MNCPTCERKMAVIEGMIDWCGWCGTVNIHGTVYVPDWIYDEHWKKEDKGGD